MWDYNEEYKGYLRHSVEMLRRQGVQWQREVDQLRRLEAKAKGLLLKQLRRRAAFYLHEMKALNKIVCAYEHELREQEEWGLPGLMFEGKASFAAACLHQQAGMLMADFVVKSNNLLAKDRREREDDAKRTAKTEKIRAAREARKAEMKRKVAAERKRQRRLNRMREKGGWR